MKQPKPLLSPLTILDQARRAVPVVNYALGAAGIAAAGALVIGFLGYNKAALITFFGVLVAMLLLIAFSRLPKNRSPAVGWAGIAMLWSVSIMFIVFLIFTATAVAWRWPQIWAEILFPSGAQPKIVTVCLPAGQYLAPGSCGHQDGNWVVVGVPWDNPQTGLNVRAGPGVAAIPQGSLLPNTTNLIVGSCELNWCQVQCKDVKGWSNRRFLSLRSDALRHVTGISTDEPLEMRNGPEQVCSPVGRIPHDAANVILHSCQPDSTGKNTWCLVTHNQFSGWIPYGHLQ